MSTAAKEIEADTAAHMDFPGKREQVLALSQHKGLVTGGITGAITSGAVLAAQQMSAAFRGKTNVSARVALAVSPALAAYVIASENTMQKAQYNPAAYGIYPKGHVYEKKPQAVDHLKWYHHAANTMYSNPFALIAGVGVPAVGAIFYQQTLPGHNHLKLSQKVMHTRVFGQMTVLGVLVSTMLFRDYMYKNGGLFVEAADGTVHREHEEEVAAHT